MQQASGKSCGQVCVCSCSRSTPDAIPPLSEKQKPDVLEKAAVPHLRALRNKKGWTRLRREPVSHPSGLLGLQISLWKDRQKQPLLPHSDSG